VSMRLVKNIRPPYLCFISAESHALAQVQEWYQPHSDSTI